MRVWTRTPPGRKMSGATTDNDPTRRCQMEATGLWPLWQAILLSFALGFTQRGKQRFVQWATGLALNVEEHTVTQSLIALGRPEDWKALESFAEYGHWSLFMVRFGLARRLERLPDRLWH